MPLKHKSDISPITMAASLCLVSLRMLALASRSALIENSWGCFFWILADQIFWRKKTVNQTKGSSSPVLVSKPSVRTWFGDGLGMWAERQFSRSVPASPLNLHWKKAWGRSSTTWSWHSWQRGVLLGRILLNLSCDGRSLWRTFHRNDVISGPRPFNLAKCQLLSQSLSGEASSVLDGFNCLASDTGCCSMVMLSSSRRVYHWLQLMVATFRGVFSCTDLMWEKNSRE